MKWRIFTRGFWINSPPVFDKKNTRNAIAVAAIGIVIGIVATLSFTMYPRPVNSDSDREDCTGENNCAILPIDDSKYMLKGKG